MSGSYFARFIVKHTDDSNSYLRQAHRNVSLHTDGTYVDEPTDWLMMMKMAERHAEGGESRLLHLDDWSDLGRFHRHPLGTHSFAFKAPPSKNVEKSVSRPIFHSDVSGIGISYIDQFAQPETIEQARYLFDLSQSLENSPEIKAPRLPVGTLIMLNNHFWMHGRAGFRRNEQLHRELMRLRGGFLRRTWSYRAARTRACPHNPQSDVRFRRQTGDRCFLRDLSRRYAAVTVLVRSGCGCEGGVWRIRKFIGACRRQTLTPGSSPGQALSRSHKGRGDSRWGAVRLCATDFAAARA